MNWKHVRNTEGLVSRSLESSGLAIWLLEKWHNARNGLAIRGLGKQAPRLALVERITLAPRQTLALVEAEGRRFLVASSAACLPRSLSPPRSAAFLKCSAAFFLSSISAFNACS